MKLRELLYQARTNLFVPSRQSCHGLILMFHRVVEDSCAYQHPQIARLHVTAGHLESCLLTVRAQGYDVISPDELHDRLHNRRNGKFVVFTFDDAYRDSYDLVLPLFQKHCAPFTVYVPTAVPDRQMYWWYFMLDDLVYRHDVIETAFIGEKRRFITGTAQQKEQIYFELATIINGIADHQRSTLLPMLFEPYGLYAADYADKLSMSWQQLRDMQQTGFATIGGHTVNHFNLQTMAPDDVINEMEQGRQRLATELGCRVDHFSYPFGAAGYREFALARQLGFQTATTCQTGRLTSGHRHYCERLPRIMVEETTSIASLLQ